MLPPNRKLKVASHAEIITGKRSNVIVIKTHAGQIAITPQLALDLIGALPEMVELAQNPARSRTLFYPGQKYYVQPS